VFLSVGMISSHHTYIQETPTKATKPTTSMSCNFNSWYSSQRFIDCILQSTITTTQNILNNRFYWVCNINDFYNFSKVEGQDFLKMTQIHRNMYVRSTVHKILLIYIYIYVVHSSVWIINLNKRMTVSVTTASVTVKLIKILWT